MRMRLLSKQGDKRTVKKFAWFPVTLGELSSSGRVTEAVPEIRIWLERYKEDQYRLFDQETWITVPWWRATKRYK